MWFITETGAIVAIAYGLDKFTMEAKARLCMIKEEARMDAIRERCEKEKIDCDARRIKVGTWYQKQKGVVQNMEEEGMHVMGVGSGA